MPNRYGLVRSERKEIVGDIIRPQLTSKKDRSILDQYHRIEPGPDQRVRTVLSPVVTETGRLASGESFVDPHSTNLQNLAKKESYKDQLYRVRDCFISDPGMSLLACDYEGAESVVMAFESGNWDFYEALIQGQDTHRWIAAEAYHGGDEDAVTKAERQRCKNVYYASLYLAGIPKITRTINADAEPGEEKLTEQQVEVVWQTIMDMLELDLWWDQVWDELMDPELYGGRRWLQNSLGFRRMFYNPDDHKLHKEAVNFFPQSTVASLIDRSLIQIWEELDSSGQCELLLQVHDELLFQVPEGEEEHWAVRIRQIMEQSFQARGRQVYIPTDARAGKRWDEFRGPESEPLDPDNELGRLEAL